MGQVLDGGLARPPGPDLDHGGGRVRRVGRRGFTGYLSQQNFDAQWIATNGKDAINATGVGAFFNLMNFGQMLMWHIVLVPDPPGPLVGAHVLLVRVRGVSAIRCRSPGPAAAARRAARGADRGGLARPDPPLRHPQGGHDRRPWSAHPHRWAGRTAVLARCAAGHVKSWAKVAPADFLATAATELAGTSQTAGYGPPYNNNGTSQKILSSPANWAGVRQPIDAAQTFVLGPLAKTAPTDPAAGGRLTVYNAASLTSRRSGPPRTGTR